MARLAHARPVFLKPTPSVRRQTARMPGDASSAENSRILERRRHLVAESQHVVSADGDLTHVDGDQQRLRDELVVALPGEAPSGAGADDVVHVVVDGGIEQPGGPAEYGDGEGRAATM